MLQEGKGWVAPNPINVELTLQERHQVYYLVTNIVRNRPTYSLENALLGWLGHGAWAKYLLEQGGFQGVCDLNQYPGGDGGIDATIAGTTIQIKTRRPGRRCTIPRIKNRKLTILPARIFAFAEGMPLVTEKAPPIRLLGWVTNITLRNYAQLDLQPYGQTYLSWIDDIYLESPMRLVKLLQAHLYEEHIHD